MAEPSERARTMTVEDCARISEAVSPLLDLHDPIPGAYSLEVSSPGLDRPLVKPADFERFKGERVRIEAAEPVEGRRRFTGTLEGLAADRVVVLTEAGRREIPLAAVQKARLSLSEALAAAPRPGRRT
jgi:ribosome maturation factor RimP